LAWRVFFDPQAFRWPDSSPWKISSAQLDQGILKKSKNQLSISIKFNSPKGPTDHPQAPVPVPCARWQSSSDMCRGTMPAKLVIIFKFKRIRKPFFLEVSTVSVLCLCRCT